MRRRCFEAFDTSKLVGDLVVGDYQFVDRLANVERGGGGRPTPGLDFAGHEWAILEEVTPRAQVILLWVELASLYAACNPLDLCQSFLDSLWSHVHAVPVVNQQVVGK